MRELTDKNYILVLRGKNRIFLTKEEAENIKEAIKHNEFIEIGDRLISKYAIEYIIPGHEYETAEKIKRGEWKCEHCGRWHSRNEECGCQGGKF